MPGGSKYRQWYAMRKAMQERGTWKGNAKHSVPNQEEGEPAPKQPRWYERTIAGADLGGPLDSGPSSAESDGPPPLEDSPTPEGESWL